MLTFQFKFNILNKMIIDYNGGKGQRMKRAKINNTKEQEALNRAMKTLFPKLHLKHILIWFLILCLVTFLLSYIKYKTLHLSDLLFLVPVDIIAAILFEIKYESHEAQIKMRVEQELAKRENANNQTRQPIFASDENENQNDLQEQEHQK